MLATERATVDQINQLARVHLVACGHVARRARAYRSAADARVIRLAADRGEQEAFDQEPLFEDE